METNETMEKEQRKYIMGEEKVQQNVERTESFLRYTCGCDAETALIILSRLADKLRKELHEKYK